jgi:hypothetical protein
VEVKPPAITLAEPFPLLDPGLYVALCPEASHAWARQWKKWIARLALEPQNYQGRPYTGRLCKFLGLGKDPLKPYAGPQSHFRRLLVEVNGKQPTRADANTDVFVGVLYNIEVVTVTNDRDGKPRLPEHWYSIVRAIHPCNPGCAGTRTPPTLTPEPFNSSTQRTQTTLSTDQHSNIPTPLARMTPVVCAQSESVASKADILRDLSRVPAELQSFRQWVAWRYKQSKDKSRGKPTKVPINPITGRHASSTDTATWSDYQAAIRGAVQFRCSGVGYVFSDSDPYSGIDLDDCRDPETGRIQAWAWEIIHALNSYTEVSPSQTGVKIWVRGKLTPDAHKRTAYHNGEVEMYSRERFFTVTGKYLEGTPTTIDERQPELEAVYSLAFSGRKVTRCTAPQTGNPIVRDARRCCEQTQHGDEFG